MNKVNQKSKNLVPRHLFKNERGQMAIFLVLIFQLLFAFFAMAINIGLVVHDKINLQNSTDMAAYYGASRQAEMLNQIGHINYQMRQAYKLLTFRIRGIGSAAMGFPGNGSLPLHPFFNAGGVSNTATETQPFFEDLGAIHAPGVCAASTLWKEYLETDSSSVTSFCRDLNAISDIPNTGGGGGLLSGLVSSLDSLIDQVRSEAQAKCNQMGQINWQLASRFLLSYRQETGKRIKMIEEVAEKLSEPGQSMRDYRGSSVLEGVRKTLEKNLTDPQRASLNVNFINSLSSDVGGCESPEAWLSKIELLPVVTYVDMHAPAGQICQMGVKPNRGNLPTAGASNGTLIDNWNFTGATPYGVEKNPWCMPYVGVSAQTNPRKIFSPLGGGISLRAISFAKPFGGRIGPWYNSQWPNGARNSSGGERVDPLLPSRSVAGSTGGSSPADDLVNYSKYPGDRLGMNSVYALSSVSDFFFNTMAGGASIFSSARAVFSWSHYQHVGNGAQFESIKDSLAFANGVNSPPADNMRLLEEAAIAPDLFDITYYAIESRFDDNFLNNTDPQFNSDFSDAYFDLGSRGQNPYNVTKQMERARQVFQGGFPFYNADNPRQLLTSWTQKEVVNYEFPDEFFANCLFTLPEQDSRGRPAPSGCAAGGRSGYSIKFVSKNYLETSNIEGLGGVGNDGSIQNPPPSDFGQ